MKLYPPRQVLINDHQAHLWNLVIDGVPYLAVWWIADGTLRVSYPQDEQDWSPFMKLGSRWSPRHDLVSAQMTIRQWAESREEAVST